MVLDIETIDRIFYFKIAFFDNIYFAFYYRTNLLGVTIINLLAGMILNIQGVLCRPMLLLAQQASVP